MRNINDMEYKCPPQVHERILFTLNSLPRANKTKSHTVRASFLAAASVLVALFITLWAIDPALAAGNTFRNAVSSFFGFNPSAKEIIEPPLAAPDIAEAQEAPQPEQTAQLSETAVLTQPDEQGVQVPTAAVSGYVFELEPETLYDGVILVAGYNVRREDGEPMPPEAEYTKDHIAGFIREYELIIDGKSYSSGGGAMELDWSDPYIYRQVCTYDLSGLDKPITEDTEIIMRVAVHEYRERPLETITTFADLPFSVNTSHEDSAGVLVAAESVFTRGDFTVELMPITQSATRTLITIRAYKDGDPDFGKKMDGYLAIQVKDMDGMTFPCPPNSGLASYSFGENDDGSSYLKFEWYVDPLFELPDKFQLTFASGDVNPAESVSYEPIIIELP